MSEAGEQTAMLKPSRAANDDGSAEATQAPPVASHEAHDAPRISSKSLGVAETESPVSLNDTGANLTTAGDGSSSTNPLTDQSTEGGRSPLTSGRPKKGSVQIREPPVTEKRGYKIVKIEQKHGILHRAIPVMPFWLAVLCCVFNIFLPSTGTLISAFTVFCCGIRTRMSRPIHAMALNLVAGLLQMATFLLIVGWIWSILWGMTFVQLALSAKEDAAVVNPAGLPYYVRRHSSVE